MSTNEIDFKLTEDRSMELNGRGDVATVSGQLLEQQEVVVRIFNKAIPLKGQRSDPNLLRELEADLEDALDKSGYFDPPYYINATADGPHSVRATIETADSQFVIEP